MIQLAYFSTATEVFDSDRLGRLLVQAQANNRSQGITGLLCHLDGSFLQFLEGDAAAVEALFARISRDPRHRDVLLVRRAQIASRAFPDWAMALVHPEDVSEAERAFVHSLRALDLAATGAEHPELVALLNAFKTWLR